MHHKILSFLALLSISTISFSKENIPACDVGKIQRAINRYFHDKSVDFEIDQTRCQDHWAVSSGTLGPFDKPKDGPQGAPTSIILHYRHHHWKVMERVTACGTYQPSTPEAYPNDAKLPKPLYPEGCLAG